MESKKATVQPLLIALDAVGFAMIFVGAGIIRFARDEILVVLGGFVIAGGVTILSLTRFVAR